MALAQERTILDVFVGEPLRIVLDQPHQALLSTGSVTIMAQYAATSDIVPWYVGYAIAIGVEWAYLRGLSSDARARTRWGDALNWSAFAIVVLWGVLWVARTAHVVPEHPDGLAGWLISASHVVPIAWLSLCSAMCHRAAQGAAERAAQLRRERDEAWERAQAEEDRKLERWKEAQRVKLELKLTADAATHAPASTMRRDARPESMNAEPQVCPNCGAQIPDRSVWLAARRWKRCAACKAS